MILIRSAYVKLQVCIVQCGCLLCLVKDLGGYYIFKACMYALALAVSVWGTLSVDGEIAFLLFTFYSFNYSPTHSCLLVEKLPLTNTLLSSLQSSPAATAIPQ